jgi:hypothetical protein
VWWAWTGPLVTGACSGHGLLPGDVSSREHCLLFSSLGPQLASTPVPNLIEGSHCW